MCRSKEDFCVLDPNGLLGGGLDEAVFAMSGRASYPKDPERTTPLWKFLVADKIKEIVREKEWDREKDFCRWIVVSKIKLVDDGGRILFAPFEDGGDDKDDLQDESRRFRVLPPRTYSGPKKLIESGVAFAYKKKRGQVFGSKLVGDQGAPFILSIDDWLDLLQSLDSASAVYFQFEVALLNKEIVAEKVPKDAFYEQDRRLVPDLPEDWLSFSALWGDMREEYHEEAKKGPGFVGDPRWPDILYHTDENRARFVVPAKENRVLLKKDGWANYDAEFDTNHHGEYQGSDEEDGWEEPWAEDVSQVDIVDIAGSDDDGALCEDDKRGLASFLPANYGNVARGGYDLLGSVNRGKQSGDRAPLTTVPQKGRGRDGRDRDRIPPFGGSLAYNSFQNGC